MTMSSAWEQTRVFGAVIDTDGQVPENVLRIEGVLFGKGDEALLSLPLEVVNI